MKKTEEILNLLIAFKEMYPDEKISDLAQKVGASPIFIIDALNYGTANEIIHWDRKEDTLEVLAEIDICELEFGDEVALLVDTIRKLVVYENGRNQDINLDQMRYWCLGINGNAVELAIHILKASGQLVSYMLFDPRDHKSRYEFLTQPDNKEKEWGLRQFRTKKK